MANRRVGGIIFFKIDGQQFSAKGNFTYNIGIPKREAVIGSDGVHGFKELPQPSKIEGQITDNDELDLEALLRARDVTCTLELANGKVIVLQEAFYSADGDASSEEGEIQIMMTGVRGKEIS